MNCLLCGVGGQGTVLASRIIAEAAMSEGYFARTAETIGMAQRGGSVVSHVRFGDNIYSPLIPVGTADVIIGSEPGETVRNLRYLRAGGTVIVSSRAVFPVTDTLSESTYNAVEMIAYLRSKSDRCHVIDADRIESECGMIKVLNVALIGAAVACGSLGFSLSAVEGVLSKKLKPSLVEINKSAVRLGADMIGELK